MTRYSDKPMIITGSVVNPLFTTQLHNNTEKQGKKTVLAQVNMPQIMIDTDIVAAASEAYQISPNVDDYIMVPLPIVTSDIPNRNLQGFSKEELFFFEPQYGQMVYETFRGKCTFADHKNDNPLESKGIITDVSAQFIPKYDVWKILIFTLWDRSKDTRLAQDIIDRKKNGYSMGAMVNNFVCSVCGKIDSMNNKSCEHMQKKGEIWGRERRLASQLCVGTTFFECSNVGDTPADATAFSQEVYI